MKQMKKWFFPLTLAPIVALIPLVAFAQVGDVFDVLAYIINATVLVLIGAGTLLFMYGIITYILAQGDEKKLAEGKKYILYGIIGLVAMVAVWGFVNLIITTIFGFSTIGLSTPSVTPFGVGRSGSGNTVIRVLCVLGLCY